MGLRSVAQRECVQINPNERFSNIECQGCNYSRNNFAGSRSNRLAQKEAQHAAFIVRAQAPNSPCTGWQIKLLVLIKLVALWCVYFCGVRGNSICAESGWAYNSVCKDQSCGYSCFSDTKIVSWFISFCPLEFLRQILYYWNRAQWVLGTVTVHSALDLWVHTMSKWVTTHPKHWQRGEGN